MKIFRIISLFAFGFLFLVAGESLSARNKKVEVAPQPVEWLSECHDFGAFEEDDGPVTCTFSFVNNSKEPIAITSARASCGCTVPSYPRRAISPGDTATIKVTYDPTGRPGRFEKNVKVKLSDNAIPQVTLRITGVVIGNSNSLRSRYPVAVGPLRLRTEMLPFGPVSDIRSKSEFFEVYNASTDSIKPEWVNVPDYINVSTVSPIVPPGEQIAYAISLIPAKLRVYGLVTDTLTLIPAPGASPKMIEILANIKEDFSRLTPGQRQNAPVAQFSTETIDLGAVDDRSTLITTSFTVTNRGKSPLIIRRIYSLDPGISAEASVTTIKKGKSAKITVTIDPAAINSEMINGRLSVITNDPDNPDAIIRITGY